MVEHALIGVRDQGSAGGAVETGPENRRSDRPVRADLPAGGVIRLDPADSRQHRPREVTSRPLEVDPERRRPIGGQHPTGDRRATSTHPGGRGPARTGRAGTRRGRGRCGHRLCGHCLCGHVGDRRGRSGRVRQHGHRGGEPVGVRAPHRLAEDRFPDDGQRTIASWRRPPGDRTAIIVARPLRRCLGRRRDGGDKEDGGHHAGDLRINQPWGRTPTHRSLPRHRYLLPKRSHHDRTGPMLIIHNLQDDHRQRVPEPDIPLPRPPVTLRARHHQSRRLRPGGADRR